MKLTASEGEQWTQLINNYFKNKINILYLCYLVDKKSWQIIDLFSYFF